MVTVRQIERVWDAKDYGRLANDLLSVRVENSPRLGMELGRATPSAALALIRMDELSQGGSPAYRRLLGVLLKNQQADGGWGDVITTAVCLRALLCGGGNGQAVQRAVEYLRDLQKADGLWPGVPIRRAAGDTFVSAFVLLQVGDQPKFQAQVQVEQAVNWFLDHEEELDYETQRLWALAKVRCGGGIISRDTRKHLWS